MTEKDLPIPDISMTKNAFQSKENHSLADSMGYIKLKGMKIFFFDLDVPLTLMCDLDLINDL